MTINIDFEWKPPDNIGVRFKRSRRQRKITL